MVNSSNMYGTNETSYNHALPQQEKKDLKKTSNICILSEWIYITELPTW